MNKKMKLLIVGGAFAAAIGASTMLYNSLKAEYAPPEIAQAMPAADKKKAAAPDFSVVDAAGSAVNFSDFKGKPIVLNFWASWCPPCRVEMPEFDRVSESLGGDVVFLMVNMTDGSRETKEKAQDYVNKEGFSFPIYFDTAASAASAYGITALPTTYFIDKESNVVKGIRGSIDAATLQSGIELIR